MPTILIADDQAYIRLVCRTMLEQYQLNVVEAQDGREAVDLYIQLRPDGVILDINMPVLNGLEALEAIRRFDPTARVAILTGQGQEQLMARAVQAGVSDFVFKPFSATRLERAARSLLNGALPSD